MIRLEKVLAICIGIILIIGGVQCEADEALPYVVCWVTEEYYKYSALYAPNLTGRKICTYNLTTGEKSEEEIPLNWNPLETNRPEEGLYFYVEESKGRDSFRIRIIRWHPDGTEEIANGIEVCDGGFPWIYQDGILYTQIEKNHMEEDAQIIPKDTDIVKYIEVDGVSHVYPRAKFSIPVLSREGKLYTVRDNSYGLDIMHEIRWNEDGEEKTIGVQPNDEFVEEYPEYPNRFSVPFIFGDAISYTLCNQSESMYFWMPVSKDYLPLIRVRCVDPDWGDIGWWHIPFHGYLQLLKLDIANGECRPVLVEDQGVYLKDKKIIAGKAKVGPDDEYIIVETEDVNPVLGLFESWWGNTPSTALYFVSLEDGEVITLAEAGYETIKYDELFRIVLKASNDIERVDPVGEYWDEIDDAFAVAIEPRLGEGWQHVEMFPANFCIACFRVEE